MPVPFSSLLTRMHTKCFWCAILLFALALSKLFAYDQPAFTGSEAPLDKSTQQADAIFTGQIEYIGPAVAKALGEKFYGGVKIKVLTVLKGTVVNPEVTAALIARMDTKVPEAAPGTGNIYLFFAKKQSMGSQFRVFKLLPADDAIITQVKQLVVAAHK